MEKKNILNQSSYNLNSSEKKQIFYTSILFNKMKNLEDFYEVIEYICKNFDILDQEQFALRINYQMDYKEYKKIYTLYRNKIFQEEEIGKKLFFWDIELDFRIRKFYNNVYIRISYYRNKNFTKYKFIYPGEAFDRLIDIKREQGEIKIVEGKIYYIKNIEEKKEIKQPNYQEKKKTNLIMYDPIGCTTDEFINDYVENIKIERGIGIKQEEEVNKEKIKEYIEWIEKNYDQTLYEEYKKKGYVVKRIYNSSYIKNTSELFNKMKNLEDFYEIIEYIWKKYTMLYSEYFLLQIEEYKEEYLKNYKEYKEIYTLYRNKIFQEEEIGKKLFFWNTEENFEIMKFYNNVYIRISYYRNKNFTKYKFIYPGEVFDRLIDIKREQGEIKAIEGKIYYISDPSQIKNFKKLKVQETNLIIYNPDNLTKEECIEELSTPEYYESTTEEEYEEEVEAEAEFWAESLEESKNFINDYVENIKIEQGIGIEFYTGEKNKEKIKEYIEWIEKNYDQTLYEEYFNKKEIKIQSNVLYIIFIYNIFVICEILLCMLGKDFCLYINLFIISYIGLKKYYKKIYNKSLLQEIENKYLEKLEYKKKKWYKKILLIITTKILTIKEYIKIENKKVIIKTFTALFSILIIIFFIKKLMLMIVTLPLINQYIYRPFMEYFPEMTFIDIILIPLYPFSYKLEAAGRAGRAAVNNAAESNFVRTTIRGSNNVIREEFNFLDETLNEIEKAQQRIINRNHLERHLELVKQGNPEEILANNLRYYHEISAAEIVLNNQRSLTPEVVETIRKNFGDEVIHDTHLNKAKVKESCEKNNIENYNEKNKQEKKQQIDKSLSEITRTKEVMIDSALTNIPVKEHIEKIQQEATEMKASGFEYYKTIMQNKNIENSFVYDQRAVNSSSVGTLIKETNTVMLEKYEDPKKGVANYGIKFNKTDPDGVIQGEKGLETIETKTYTQGNSVKKITTNSELKKIREKGVDDLSIIYNNTYVRTTLNDQPKQERVNYTFEIKEEEIEKIVETFLKTGNNEGHDTVKMVEDALKKTAETAARRTRSNNGNNTPPEPKEEF
uniref:hypothetical protein n=1 Tax=Thecamoeba quadrilineata TaxID=343530 RepID=UPI00226C8CC4|nr:hypothetical protein OYV93_mgp36 [Thecamoeba quadrilineata]UZN43826.1 hypothetical protein [Thecamoeba quadrilineata]